MRQGKFLFLIGAFVIIGAAGCGAEATVLRDTPTGGVVSYPFETESDILTTARRGAAFRLIGEKCPHGSRIVKEGEIPKVSKKADKAWRGQISSDRLWAIEFTCV
jgi:hypothetical protein